MSDKANFDAAVDFACIQIYGPDAWNNSSERSRDIFRNRMRKVFASLPCHVAQSGECVVPRGLCAKALEWDETPVSSGSEWYESRMGFAISFDPTEDAGSQYSASWGDGDNERCATLIEAKDWCQSTADGWIRECGQTAPVPPQPVQGPEATP